MKRKPPEAAPKQRRGAAQLNATLTRINAALQVLQVSGEHYENISQLAEAVSGICNVHRSLLLRKGKSYRTCLDRYPALVGNKSELSTPYNLDIDPQHPVMIQNAQLEAENLKLRRIVDDLSKRPSAEGRAQRDATKTAEVPRYHREYEVTCQLVDRILDYKRAIRIIDDTLTDLSDISGIPKPIADSKLIAPYLKWKNTRARIE